MEKQDKERMKERQDRAAGPDADRRLKRYREMDPGEFTKMYDDMDEKGWRAQRAIFFHALKRNILDSNPTRLMREKWMSRSDEC